MNAIVVSGFVVGYLVSAGAVYGLLLRWLPRKGKFHEGTEDLHGRYCTADATCEVCQTNAVCVAAIWPLAIVGAAVYALIVGGASALITVAGFGARLTQPEKPNKRAE